MPDRERSEILWEVDVDGEPHRGVLRGLNGGISLDSQGRPSGGQLGANLRYVYTGKPMWDMWLSELFFEVLKTGHKMLVIEVESLTLAPAGRAGVRSAEAKVILGFARGAYELTLPVRVTEVEGGVQIRSMKAGEIDLASSGYEPRLALLQSVLGVGDLSSVVRFEFDLLFATPSSPPPRPAGQK